MGARAVRWRRKRDCGFQVFEVAESDLVVRPSPERVSDTGRCRAIPQAARAAHVLRAELQVVHEAHCNRHKRKIRFRYPAAQSAVELAEPATQLALVIEAAPENGLPARLIPELAYRPLGEMVKLPMVANHLGPLLERHRRSIEILRERIEARDGVIFFDVSDLDLEGYNKFIPYLLHPECIYSVSVSASAARAKISLGTNPWKQETADQNLASLAEKFGGGGHPRVSAISFDPADLPRAREIARGLAATLRGK